MWELGLGADGASAQAGDESDSGCAEGIGGEGIVEGGVFTIVIELALGVDEAVHGGQEEEVAAGQGGECKGAHLRRGAGV